MPKYIDADALLAEAKRISGPFTGDGWDNFGVYALIERQPAADVEPKRKTGRWKIAGAFDDFFQCPECGNMWPIFSAIEWAFCPVCGCGMMTAIEPLKKGEDGDVRTLEVGQE